MDNHIISKQTSIGSVLCIAVTQPLCNHSVILFLMYVGGGEIMVFGVIKLRKPNYFSPEYKI